MKNLLALLLALIMLAAPVLAWADEADDPVIKDPEAEIDAAMSFSFDSSDETTDDPEVKARGIAAVQATTCSDLVVLPQDGSWLKEWKTGYARKAFKAPCLRDIYEGTEATVLAEENKMSLIIYRGSDDRFYAGWIQSIRILDDFPGDRYTIGKEPSGDLSFRDDIALDWSRCSWLNTQQNYTVLSEEVKDCIGFTLDYQIIAENTDVWQNILGPRKVYVKTGGEWVEVGEFPYPDFGAVKVQVWLDHPMDIDAVGTIAQCRLPNTFWFRQVVTDFASPSA